MNGQTTAASQARVNSETMGASRIANGLRRFESWFNDRFGWFFTNGMKQQRTKHKDQL